MLSETAFGRSLSMRGLGAVPTSGVRSGAVARYRHWAGTGRRRQCGLVVIAGVEIVALE
jgi:hypothetical protein